MGVEELVRLGEEAGGGVVFSAQGVAAGLLLGGQGQEFGIEVGCLTCADGVLNDSRMVVGEDGDVALPDEHVGGQLGVSGNVCLFCGLPGPGHRHVEMPEILLEPARHLGVFSQHRQKVVKVVGPGLFAQVVEHVDLG